MFTGIVEAGEVVKVETHDASTTIWVRAPSLGGCEPGASVAINGVCLTVTERDSDTCRFDVSPESVTRSALGELTANTLVNIERPLRAGDELGGHIVQGHVDAVGTVSEVVKDGTDVRVRVQAPAELMRYVVEKGSITVDGVSLTVSALAADWFEVALIPHTLENTTFGDARRGRKVNLEVDQIAKYVEKLTTQKG